MSHFLYLHSRIPTNGFARDIKLRYFISSESYYCRYIYCINISICNKENLQMVVETYVAMKCMSPGKSTLKASAELSISRKSVQKMLKTLQFKLSNPCALWGWCRLTTRILWDNRYPCGADPHFPSEICWTDEVSFKLYGRVFRHNCVYWYDRNPHEELNVLFVTVWGWFQVLYW